MNDLMMGSAKLGMNVRIATPKGYECNPSILAKTKQLAKENGTKDVYLTAVASEAVKGSDVVVTDTWVSMGQVCVNKMDVLFSFYVCILSILL